MPTAESDARLTDAEHEGLIEATQSGTEVEYVEALIAERLARVIPPERG